MKRLRNFWERINTPYKKEDSPPDPTERIYEIGEYCIFEVKEFGKERNAEGDFPLINTSFRAAVATTSYCRFHELRTVVWDTTGTDEDITYTAGTMIGSEGYYWDFFCRSKGLEPVIEDSLYDIIHIAKQVVRQLLHEQYIWEQKVLDGANPVRILKELEY